MQTKNKFRYALVALATLIIVFHFLELDYNNLRWQDALLPTSMVFLILSMIFSIRKTPEDGE